MAPLLLVAVLAGRCRVLSLSKTSRGCSSLRVDVVGIDDGRAGEREVVTGDKDRNDCKGLLEAVGICIYIYTV